ncbi:MAG: D-aminoacyl-tRNA deacylase [Chitinophagales bacterium]
MRIILQRVDSASVIADAVLTGKIDRGLLLLLGIEAEDNEEDINWLVKKVLNMRIFPDEEGKMNLSLLDIQGEILVVSQFTLHASTKKGNRPSFIKAAKPEKAIPLYKKFLKQLKTESGLKVEAGVFGADMSVELVNSGPVTIWIDSKQRE